jgi:hypothetical protein
MGPQAQCVWDGLQPHFSGGTPFFFRAHEKIDWRSGIQLAYERDGSPEVAYWIERFAR